MIRLGEVLQQMERLDGNNNPVRFQIKFVTLDHKRGTGGEIIELKNAYKCVGIRNGKVIIDQRVKQDIPDIPRNPNHWVNRTRNVVLENGEMRKIHIRLIIEFNNQKVCF